VAAQAVNKQFAFTTKRMVTLQNCLRSCI